MPLWRAQHQNIYHECQRCGTRQKMADMRWQNGILVCHYRNCVDNAIIGSRDLNVARQVAIYRHELEPDKKLTTPVDRRNDMLEVLY